MKILISSIGTRGDVQPILALALELRTLGHEPSLCVAPNFRDWIESFGIPCVPIGPDLKKLTGGAAPARMPKASPEQRKQLAAHTIRAQFQVLTQAASGCGLIVGAGALQLAARSIAEMLGIRYIFATYCPVTLRSADHPPPKMDRQYSQSLPGFINRFLWAKDQRQWDELFGATLNEERAKIGLGRVQEVQRYVFTNHPWIAADPVLGPMPSTPGMQPVHTGAWMLKDETALPDDVESFLASGEPPVYLGFGSMRAAEQTSRTLITAARALGLRSIISQGWGNLAAIDAGADCLCIGDINHTRLLPRVAAVVHHGGAGTTTAAAVAGKPQVVLPHHYDQHYWARRVTQLGVGVAGPTRDELTVESIVSALRKCSAAEVTVRAKSLASRVEPHGARVAAQRMVAEEPV
jgi:vancomycin aglycone glucosyltransferase